MPQCYQTSTVISQRLPLISLLTSALFIKVAKVSCNFEGFFENILIQDTVIAQYLYLITRYSYFKKKVFYYKILLLISISRYYLQDTKIRCCPSLVINHRVPNKTRAYKKRFSPFYDIDIRSSPSVVARDVNVSDTICESTPLGPDPTSVAAISFRYS